MEPGSYWGCIVDDAGDSEADDGNAVNVIRVAPFTRSSRIVCKHGLVAVGCDNSYALGLAGL